MRNVFFVLVLVSVFIFTAVNVFAGCGVCGTGGGDKGAFHETVKEATVKDGVKEITYDQLMDIKNSGEKYVLLDVLSKESYNKGHIPGAKSFPLKTINAENAANMLSKDDHIIVYCGSFKCRASVEAAKALSALGYNVVDYKGGLADWQDKGSKLVQ